jgi:biofilm PGA synthesis lipoprotein PgaB
VNIQFKTCLIILAITAMPLDSTSPQQAVPAPPPGLPVIRLSPEPMRALQILHMDCQNWLEVNERFRIFSQAGVNTVIVRVFQNPGDLFYPFSRPRASTGVYFRTTEAPLVDDLLGPLCTLAHKNGLEILAWMTTRYADYGWEDRKDLACWAYDLEAKRYLRAKGLSIILPEVRSRLERIYADLAEYPVDGILIQDDLMLRHNEDFNPRARMIYKLSSGVELKPASLYKGLHRNPAGRCLVSEYTQEFWQWTRWKRDMLLKTADQLRSAAKQKRPGLKFGINLYYETVTEPEHGLAWLAQDLETALKHNYDFYAIMLYHRQMQREMKLTRPETESLVANGVQYACRMAHDPGRILFKMQTVDWDTGMKIPDSELETMFSYLKRESNSGWALIPAGQSLDMDWVRMQYRRED